MNFVINQQAYLVCDILWLVLSVSILFMYLISKVKKKPFHKSVSVHSVDDFTAMLILYGTGFFLFHFIQGIWYALLLLLKIFGCFLYFQ
jgi:hypothetical protein